MNLNRILPLILTTEQGSRLGLAAAGLFALLALVSLTTLLGGWWSDARLSPLSESSQVLQGLASPVEELLTTVPQAHLFGHPAPSSAYLPITSAQLRLTGVIQQGSEEEGTAFSKAIISVQGGIGKIFQVGDVLQSGVKLSGIEAEAAIIDNNGHAERLPLLRNRLERK